MVSSGPPAGTREVGAWSAAGLPSPHERPGRGRDARVTLGGGRGQGARRRGWSRQGGGGKRGKGRYGSGGVRGQGGAGAGVGVDGRHMVKEGERK